MKEGRCSTCGRVREGSSKTHCEGCRLKHNGRVRENRRKELGLKSRYLKAESYVVVPNPDEE